MTWPELSQLAVGPDTRVLEVALDASEPYLDDHRPGDLPLFGTAMGIALMARAAERVHPALLDGVISDVSVQAPLIVRGTGARATMHLTPAEAGWHVRVEGAEDADAAAALFEATITPSAGRPSNADLEESIAVAIDAARTPWRVSGDEIYRLFFHGPAFRVLAGASWVRGILLAELSDGLPPLTRGADAESARDPRWIEACMQAAGLLEVAAHDRMMIPHRLLRIEFAPHESVLQAATNPRRRRLLACARAGVDGTDMALIDDDGEVLLRITAYQTLPLPFASDGAALHALHSAFQADESDRVDPPREAQRELVPES